LRGKKVPPEILDHFLVMMAADKCMEGKLCVALDLAISQLRNNVE